MSKKITTKDVYGNNYLVDLDSLKLSIHIYGIAVEDGKVLIVPQYNGYDYPGGTLELGENHIDTLKREFKEETGLDVEPLHLLNIYTSFFHHKKRGTDYQSLLVFYAVKIVGGRLSTDGFDVDEKEYAKLAEWVPVNELGDFHHACSIDISAELVDFVRQLDEMSNKRLRGC